MINRRTFFKIAAAGMLGAVGLGSYAVAVEPVRRLVRTDYALRLPRFPSTHGPLKIGVLADFHFCDPWLGLKRLEEIVAAANAMKPDLFVLLGDFMPGMKPFRTGLIDPAEWANRLAQLNAPLGTYAILGNHDWWTDPDVPRKALGDAGIPLLENQAIRIERPAGNFWIAGTASIIAIPLGNRQFEGRDDLPGTLAQTQDDEPVILLAHEPDLFVRVPDRVALTLSGHTHGGQVRLPLIGSPIVPSEFGQRFAYGHIVEDDRHLVVSGGLGCSILPVRFGVPPEINHISISGAA